MKTPSLKLAALCAAAVLTSLAAHAADGWTDSYAKAVAQAKAENKLVLADFTGSDWCGWCIKLDEEVFSKAAFKDYAAKNLVLLELDFPNKKKLDEAVAKQNNELKAKHEIRGFPTLVVFDGDGKELAKWVGFQKGGPEALTAKIDALKKK
ncbi:MAG: thioredoxin family protein [Chthoniobacteraceae bacterium]